MAGPMVRGLKQNNRERWSELEMSSNPLQVELFAYDPSLTSAFGRRILDNSPSPPPPPAPPPRPNPAGFATPDPIVVIILGVLLFALICAAFLNSILRCLLRRRRLRAWRAAAEAAAASGHGGFAGGHGPGGDGSASAAHGLDPKILQSLPVLEFLKNETSSVGDSRAGDCSICLSEFSEKEKLRLLPKCSHIFHLDCIDMWLQSHASCPVCRDTVADGGAPPAQGQAMMVRPGMSLVGTGAAASTAGSESDLMLLIQDENGHSVAAPGSMRSDAPSFRLVAANPTGGVGVGSSRRAFVPELPIVEGQQDQQPLHLVPLGQSDAEPANPSNLRSTGSKTYFVFEAGYFFSGRWLASSSSSSASSASATSSSDSAPRSTTSSQPRAAATGDSAPSSTATQGPSAAAGVNPSDETPAGTSTSK